MAALEQQLIASMSAKEFEASEHGKRIAEFLFGEYRPVGTEQLNFLGHLAGMIASVIASEMPAIGAPSEECN